MNDTNSGKMKIIKIVDPLLCVHCDNAYIAEVMCDEGTRKRMFYCSRKDCDNWVFSSLPAYPEDQSRQVA